MLYIVYTLECLAELNRKFSSNYQVRRKFITSATFYTIYNFLHISLLFLFCFKECTLYFIVITAHITCPKPAVSLLNYYNSEVTNGFVKHLYLLTLRTKTSTSHCAAADSGSFNTYLGYLPYFNLQNTIFLYVFYTK